MARGRSAPGTSTPPAACAPTAGPAASATGGVVEVLGLACRFPESASAGAFWRHLAASADMLTADARRWPPGALGTPARCGKLPDADRFDAGAGARRPPGESAALCRPPGGVSMEGVLPAASRRPARTALAPAALPCWLSTAEHEVAQARIPSALREDAHAAADLGFPTVGIVSGSLTAGFAGTAC